MLLHQLAERLAPPRLDVQTTLDVRQVGNQLGGAVVAIDTGQCGVGSQVAAIAGRLEDPLRGVLEDAAIAQLRLLQRFKHGALGGDVFDEAFDDDFALLVRHRDAALDDPFDETRRGADPVMHGEAAKGCDGSIDTAAHPRAIIRMGDLLPRYLRVIHQGRGAVAAQPQRALADENHRPRRIVTAAIGHSFQVVDQGIEYARAV